MHVPRRIHGGRPRGKSRAACCALALGPLWLAATAARAGEVEDANAKLTDLEERVRVIGNDFRAEATPDPDAAMRRVVDAEMLFKLKNYSEAATILLDVVEKYPGAQGVRRRPGAARGVALPGARLQFGPPLLRDGGRRRGGLAPGAAGPAASGRDRAAHRRLRERRRLPEAPPERAAGRARAVGALRARQVRLLPRRVRTRRWPSSPPSRPAAPTTCSRSTSRRPSRCRRASTRRR